MEENSAEIDGELQFISNSECKYSMSANKKIFHAARETIEFQVSDKNFQLLRSLGNGKFGKVCLARKLDGIDRGQLYAIKVMRKNMFAVMELNKMKQITGKSPHFLTLFYAFETKKEYCQVMNFCQGGDLKNFAEKFSVMVEFCRAIFLIIINNSSTANTRGHNKAHCDQDLSRNF